jgi:hypothetical protein
MPSSIGMWLEMFEVVLQVVNSQEQPNASTITWINVIVYPNYYMVGALSIERVFTMCAIFAILLIAVV